MESAFQWATKEAPLTEEHMRGIRFNLHDVVLHAAEMTADPKMLEPMFFAEVSGPGEVMSGVYGVLNQRRGIIEEEI